MNKKTYQDKLVVSKQEILDYEKKLKLELDQKMSKITLRSEMKKKKQDEIFALEDDLVKFQQEKFGVEGEMFQKRKELVEPIQNKVYAAIKELASVGNYDFIFDKAGSSNILYADPKNDKSKRILKNLGY